MMLNVMVLEDCLKSSQILKSIIHNISNDIHVFCAFTLEQAEEFLKNTKFDLFFLDIHLKPNQNLKGDISGFCFAKKLRKREEYEFTPIIFVTSITELELPSYREASCYRYLVKPYRRQEVEEIVKKVLRAKEQEKGQQITIKKDGINFRIYIADIIYIKAIPRGIELVLKNETISVKYTTLKQILQELPDKEFIQCHRMFVIHVGYIEYIDLVNGVIKLKEVTQTIEIGVTYKSRMRSFLR